MSNNSTLFLIIKELDKNNLKLYQSFEEDEELLMEFRNLLGWLLPQWMSAANSEEVEQYLSVSFNEYCNKVWFAISKHPKLQAKLLACCGPGKPFRHRFVKRHRGNKRTSLRDLLEQTYGDIRETEITIWCRENSKQQVRDFAKQHGYQKDEVDAVMAEYNKVIS